MWIKGQICTCLGWNEGVEYVDIEGLQEEYDRNDYESSIMSPTSLYHAFEILIEDFSSIETKILSLYFLILALKNTQNVRTINKFLATNSILTLLMNFIKHPTLLLMTLRLLPLLSRPSPSDLFPHLAQIFYLYHSSFPQLTTELFLVILSYKDDSSWHTSYLESGFVSIYKQVRNRLELPDIVHKRYEIH